MSEVRPGWGREEHQDEENDFRPEQIWERASGRSIRIPRWLILGSLIATGILAFWTIWRVTTEVRARAAVARLDRAEPGWRIDAIEAARAVVPDAENSAPIVVAAVRAIPRDWLGPNASWSSGRLKLLGDTWAPPERWDSVVHQAMSSLGRNERPDAGTLGRLREGLAPVRETIAGAGRLVDYPRGRHAGSYAVAYPPTMYARIYEVGLLTDILGYDAIGRAAAGDGGGAVATLRARIRAARSLGDEPGVAAQFVRSQAATDLRTLERVLGLSEPGEPALAGLQGALEDEARHPSMGIALRGARGVLGPLMENAAAGRPTPGVFVPSVERRVYYGTQLRNSERVVVEALTRGIALAGSTRPEDTRRLADWCAVDLWSIYGQLDGYGSGYFYTVCDPGDVQKLFRVRGILALEIAAVACERYRLRHGRWPSGLGSLVPEFLAQVPADPGGEPLRFRTSGAGVVLEAVAPADGEDDSPESTVPGRSLRFVGDFRLFAPEERGRVRLLNLPVNVFAQEAESPEPAGP